MNRSDKFERKKYLEQLKRNSRSEYIKRMCDIIAKDTSEDISFSMKEEWKSFEVDGLLDYIRKEAKGNDTGRKS